MSIGAFGVGNYRSFEEVQRFAPLTKVNFLAGQNNAGKSNVTRFLTEHYERVTAAISTGRDISEGAFSAADVPQGTGIGRDVRFSVGQAKDGDIYQAISAKDPSIAARFAELCDALSDTDYCWIDYAIRGRKPELDSEFVERSRSALDERSWNVLWSHLTGQSGGSITHWVPQALGTLGQRIAAPEPVALIPAIRSLTSDGSPYADGDHSGLNLMALRVSGLDGG
jgi:hypothetical protein